MKTETTTETKKVSSMDFKMMFTGMLIGGFFIEMALTAVGIK